jgi:hypothetical protein
MKAAFVVAALSLVTFGRDRYRSKTGATLKGFHDALVAQGGLPIPLVQRILFRPAGTASR